MFWIFIALMVIGLIGIIVCQKKQKTFPAAQGVAFVFLVLILIGMGGTLYLTLGGGEEQAMVANEAAFMSARSSKIGAEVQKAFNGKTAVIIASAGYEKEPISKAGYDALVKSMAGVNIAATEVIESDANNAEPVEMQITAKKFNDIFAKYKNADVFVITAQMPMNASETAKFTVLRRGSKQKIAVVLNDVGQFGTYIENGQIVAGALTKTSGDALDPEKSAPKDPNAAFDVRYVLVTPANLKEVYSKNKELFVNR